MRLKAHRRAKKEFFKGRNKTISLAAQCGEKIEFLELKKK